MATASLDTNHLRPWLVYLAFIAGTVLIGALVGTTVQPGAWYASLEKPVFNPPNEVFGPVWTALYVMIGIAGARTFLAAPRSLAMKLWVAQMALNFIWSPTFFGAEMIWVAFAVIAVLWATILAYMIKVRPIDTVSAWLFVPYFAWVSFASILNASLGILN